jgi:elongation factor G
MLFNSGALNKFGHVDNGTSSLDTDPEELKRKITLSTKVQHYDWDGHRVNVVDTPGFSNFLPETRAALRVAGGAVVILSGISGVKVQTEKIWAYADEFEVSRIAFVNKMDRERSSFFRAVDDMEKVLGVKGLPVQLPIGEGPDFRGVVDLITNRACIFKGGGSAAFDVRDIPEELAERAASVREEMIETLVESDDELTERYLEGEEITAEELRGAMREGVLTRRFVPVFAGSANKNMGVNLLMDAVNRCLPSPLDKGSTKGVVRGTDPNTGEETKRNPDTDEPFSALVFKTVLDPYAGKLSVFRVYSGTVRAGDTVLNAARGSKEKLAHLFLVEGHKTHEVPVAAAGDMIGVAKLKDTMTWDTLCDPSAPIVFPPLDAPNAALSYAIHPKTKPDEDKAPTALARLMEEDQSLEFRRDEETREFILAGVGQVHLEVSVERLKSKYGCDVELKAPRVPYKETIKGTIKVQGRYKKQSGGHGQFGDTWIEFSPLPRGAGFEFENRISGGSIPRQFIPAVEKGIIEAMGKGALAGFPVVDVKAVLMDGSHHSVDSSEMAFKIAASMGFKKAMEQVGARLLEPLMSMEINVPDEYLGDVIGDINSRRGKILGAEPQAGSQTIRALVPMSEVITYAPELRSLTGDRGIFTMEFSHYDEIPTYLGKKIIESAGKDADGG